MTKTKKTTLRPYKEMIGATQDKMRELMAIPRAMRFKAQMMQQRAEIEMELVTLRGKIEEGFASEDSYKNYNFNELFNSIDRISLLERRLTQFDEYAPQLFPEI